jgi:hypothetical protein
MSTALVVARTRAAAHEKPQPGSSSDIGQEIGQTAYLLFPGGVLICHASQCNFVKNEQCSCATSYACPQSLLDSDTSIERYPELYGLRSAQTDRNVFALSAKANRACCDIATGRNLVDAIAPEVLRA